MNNNMNYNEFKSVHVEFLSFKFSKLTIFVATKSDSVVVSFFVIFTSNYGKSFKVISLN